MERLHNGFTLDTAHGTFPLGTDSMVLGHFAHLPKNARVLDLGSGCGTLGLLLCAKDPGCSVTGIELDPAAHAAALDNIRRNHLDARLSSICGDLRSVAPTLPLGSFHCCISNPPYFSGGPASKELPLARRQDCCSAAELFAAASKALKYGGDFFLVHRPEKLAELIACGAKEQLEAKRLCLVRHKIGGEVSLILLAFRKGGKPGLRWEECYLYNADGTPSDYYKQIYHIE